MYSLLAKVSNLLAAEAAATKVGQILSTMVGPVLMVLGGASAIYMIVMGVQYARAEDDSKRSETKKRILNAFIGMVIIVVLAVLCMAIDWNALINSIFGYAWK